MSENNSDKVNHQLQVTIPTIIQIYQLTSKSKNLKNLKLQNTHKIIKSINNNENGKRKLNELINKKDYYNYKIYKTLNDAIPKDEEYEPQESSPMMNIDSKYINNKYLAEKYVKQYILNNESKVYEIKKIIDEQMTYQIKAKQEREFIIEKFQKLKKNLSGDKVELTKLNNVNSNINSNKLIKLQKDFEEELDKFDKLIYFNCKRQSYNCENLLTLLKIPFFIIDENYKYPDLNNDKAFMLDFLKLQILK